MNKFSEIRYIYCQVSGVSLGYRKEGAFVHVAFTFRHPDDAHEKRLARRVIGNILDNAQDGLKITFPYINQESTSIETISAVVYKNMKIAPLNNHLLNKLIMFQYIRLPNIELKFHVNKREYTESAIFKVCLDSQRMITAQFNVLCDFILKLKEVGLSCEVITNESDIELRLRSLKNTTAKNDSTYKDVRMNKIKRFCM